MKWKRTKTASNYPAKSIARHIGSVIFFSSYLMFVQYLVVII